MENMYGKGKGYKKTKVELPLSLIETDILPRLPVKTIGRCMCVCKHWKSFLSTPMFARVHLLNHTIINDYKLLQLDHEPAVTFRTLDGSTTTIRCNPNPDPSAEYIVASLDGLVCLASREAPTKLGFWNPLTGAYKKLSSSPGFYYSGLDAVGFYIDSSNDYRLLYLTMGGFFGTHIYSHRLDSWREIVSPVESNSTCIWSEATVCSQIIYFIVKDMLEGDRWIISFDMNTESFRRIGFPSVPVPHGRDYNGSLVVLNGCIHLCVSYAIIINYVWLKQGDLWRMDGDDGWMNVATFTGPLYKNFERHKICVTSTGNWLAVWDQDKNSCKKMNIEDFTKQYWYFCSPSWKYRSSRMIYVETLVSPNP